MRQPLHHRGYGMLTCVIVQVRGHHLDMTAKYGVRTSLVDITCSCTERHVLQSSGLDGVWKTKATQVTRAVETPPHQITQSIICAETTADHTDHPM